VLYVNAFADKLKRDQKIKEEISGRKPDYGFFSRLTYGVGEIFGGGCFVIINAFFIVFLTDAMGMPAALIGLGNAGSLTGIFAIMADMTDVDELITSMRRPGIVSSVATFIRKIASGISAALIGFMLSAVHYNEALANSGMLQEPATQHGIGVCFIMAPAILSALLLIVAVLFPMTSTEFDLVQKEIARKKGEDTSETTEEEKKILEKVTGFAYDKLWKKENAGVKSVLD